MTEDDLLKLVDELPDPPPPAPSENRPVALACGTDDPIYVIPILEVLVTRLERTFSALFKQVFLEPSDLGPGDYFGRELAWDVAKNIDIITHPADFAIILASETIPSQFDYLFVAFCQWRNEVGLAAAIADAAARQEAVRRNQNLNKIPDSVEGAQLRKARSEVEKVVSKAAAQAARDTEKEGAARDKALATAEAEAVRKKAKDDADALKEAKKEALLAQRKHMYDTQQAHQGQRTTGKRGADDQPEASRSKNKGPKQPINPPLLPPHLPTSTTHPVPPIENAMIDPRLYHLDSS
ncbi:uncharacterized protein MELLADRAFT_112771 [Melampsora larici-populina 98AG31]|uniref:Uncharacterized protein n=1 Tax=Melampsora larici-populina (strain 98AG31 / pathotype 3-4-7) TaxID=747676 RepID=F4S7J3_MELLP|nr:uncharacterized protein MELLADRAFT_112771 [Melampsora larici-populina 98AG31]EGF99330.1 hypothetical protein MELLADRAFT_112771 [Melampsora larici-populina 98AG31]